MALEQLLASWGLPALLLGSIAEGDGVAFLGGVLAHRQIFPFEAAALTVAAGAVAIDQTMFHLGRYGAGLGFVRRLLARPAARGLLGRIGRRPVAACLAFRFIYGLKTLGALTIGAAGVSVLSFTTLDLVACLVWAHLLTALGFGAGRLIEVAFGHLPLHHHLLIALAVLVALAGALMLMRRQSRTR